MPHSSNFDLDILFLLEAAAVLATFVRLPATPSGLGIAIVFIVNN